MDRTESLVLRALRHAAVDGQMREESLHFRFARSGESTGRCDRGETAGIPRPTAGRSGSCGKPAGEPCSRIRTDRELHTLQCAAQELLGQFARSIQRIPMALWRLTCGGRRVFCNAFDSENHKFGRAGLRPACFLLGLCWTTRFGAPTIASVAGALGAAARSRRRRCLTQGGDLPATRRVPVLRGTSPLRTAMPCQPRSLLNPRSGWAISRSCARSAAGGWASSTKLASISLNRQVALKVLCAGLGLTDKAVQRFRREAEAAARLHHTNIVPIYATGEDKGIHYYAMELIAGPSLDHVIHQLRKGDSPLSRTTPVAPSSGASIAPDRRRPARTSHRS